MVENFANYKKMANKGAAANSRKMHSLEDLLICPVCLDCLQDPRTLSCLHTFCTNCLEGCHRLHRRDLECPVCKRLTSLSTFGIQGLPMDHRIQQIRDIVDQTARVQTISNNGTPTTQSSIERCQSCDPCKSEKDAVVAATCHCIQCFMYFCETCTKKHDGIPLLAGHDRIHLFDGNAKESLFCPKHKERPFRYFCKVCHILLCTICTMDHDPRHQAEAFEKGLIEKCRHHLEESLVTVASKLNEVTTKTKCLETLRQNHQSCLYQVQALIRERAENFTAKIHEQERMLLEDAQDKFDTKLKGCGMEKMAELTFFKTNLEMVLNEIQLVLKGPPQICLLRYDELKSRISAISETMVPSVGKYKAKKSIKFIPTTQDMDFILGTLQEISLGELDDRDEECHPQSPSTTGDTLSPVNPPDFMVSSPRLRKRAILNAVSPVRKELKVSKMKSVNRPNTSSTSVVSQIFSASSKNGALKEATRRISAASEAEVSSGTNSVGEHCGQSPPRLPSSTTNEGNVLLTLANSSLPSSTTTEATALLGSCSSTIPRLLFSIEEIGGLPGKISLPSSVAFLPDGSIVIAECEHRLQLFDRYGQSFRVMGWGRIRPQSVAVTPSGLIACTDKKEQSVKIFNILGELIESWPLRMFGMPAGIAASSCGNFVVSDVDRGTITSHGQKGNIGLTITQPNCTWPYLSNRFNSPAHLAVDRNHNIFVSDPSESCVQMFDKMGKFVLRFALPNTASGTWYNSPFRPQGLCVDANGNIAVCDMENHRISLFSPDGVYLKDLLTEQNGVKYPCNVAISFSGNEIAVVESHGGILTNNPHHAVKVFSLV